jgi:hypothetical protein
MLTFALQAVKPVREPEGLLRVGRVTIAVRAVLALFLLVAATPAAAAPPRLGARRLER